MLPGSTIVDDGVLQRGMASLKQVHEDGATGWPIMGWDVDGTFWIRKSAGLGIFRAGGWFDFFKVSTTETSEGNKDNATIIASMCHQLLCRDGVFRSLRDIVSSGIRIQHIRGNGHSVTVKSIEPLGQEEYGYGIVVDTTGCYVHNSMIHKGA